MRCFILSAGQKPEIDGVNRSLIKLNGECLLDRTLRLTAGMERLVVGYDSALKRNRIKMINPEDNRCMVESFYSLMNGWADHNIILLGDVYYSDEDYTKIYDGSRLDSIMMYYRRFGPKISVFAMTFPRCQSSILLDDSEEAIQQFIINGTGGKFYDLYKIMKEHGSPVSFIPLEDKTRDFDSQKHISEWNEKYGTSR